MKVLHLDSGRSMRGGQWQALYLHEGLLRDGFDSLLLAPRGSPLALETARRGLPCAPLRLWRARASVDLVHAHDARSHTLAALLAKAPVIVARRVAFPVGAGALSRWKYAAASHYIAVSRCVRERLEGAGIRADRISVVHDGVPLLEPSPLQPGRIVAAWSDDPGKGGALLRAAASLAGVEIQFSRNLARDLPGAALFLYATDQEGLGSAALLAMSAAVAVVASRVGGLPEVVEDGRTGLLAGNTPESFASAIAALLGEPCRAAEMGALGRRAVAERFNVLNMVRQTAATYERILSCSKRSRHFWPGS